MNNIVDEEEGMQSLHRSNRISVDVIANKLGIKKQEDWYRVTQGAVRQHGGEGIMNMYYQSGLYKTLSAVYPEFLWYPWKFETAPHKYWNSLHNQRKYMDWLAEELNIVKESDWRKVTASQLEQHFGSSLLRMYNGSILNLLLSVYPGIEWKSVFAAPTPHKQHNLNKQRELLEWVGNRIGVRKKEDWYGVTSLSVIKNGGTNILNKYNGSVPQALMALYPEEKWIPWLFRQVPKYFWEDTKHQRMCINWLEEKLAITSPLQWSSTTIQQVSEVGGKKLLVRNKGSIFRTLLKVYPYVNWSTLFSVSYGHQHVSSLLKTLLKDHEILFNYKHPQLTHPSNKYMELDVYIPSLELALEYQGEQHYKPAFEMHERAQQKRRDYDKEQRCKELGISLVQIPYWWNCTIDTLYSTIHRHRPDINFNLE
jgi:hypothetical protein